MCISSVINTLHSGLANLLLNRQNYFFDKLMNGIGRLFRYRGLCSKESLTASYIHQKPVDRSSAQEFVLSKVRTKCLCTFQIDFIFQKLKTSLLNSIHQLKPIQNKKTLNMGQLTSRKKINNLTPSVLLITSQQPDVAVSTQILIRLITIMCIT